MKLFRHISLLFCTALLSVGFSSCLNSNDAETVSTNVYNAIVTAFSLETNSDVCANLSGYTFTIDNYGYSDEDIHSRFPNDGIIFNPDSLPMGAIADSVKVSLTCSSPDSIYFKLYDATGELGQFSNFSKDSALYFASYPDARLTISARGHRKTYHIKINVHKVKADTIAWRNLTDQLWSDVNITSQRVDTIGQTCYWLIEDNGQRNKMSCASVANLQQWKPLADVTVEGGDLLDLETLFSWHGQLYAIGQRSHNLLVSADGQQWQAIHSDLHFVSVLGSQLRTTDVHGRSNADSLNVIVRTADGLHFATSADARRWTVAQIIPDDFPVSGFSRPIATEARRDYGNLTSRLYITGGLTASGKLVAGTWSCDGWSSLEGGPNWVKFEQNEMPGLTGATVVDYTFDVTKPKSLWILYPGVNADGNTPKIRLFGKTCTTLFYSEDHGVSWHHLSRSYSQYADVTGFGGLSCHSGFSTDDNRMIFFGGQNADGSADCAIRCGQLNSLTFQLLK